MPAWGQLLWVSTKQRHHHRHEPRTSSLIPQRMKSWTLDFSYLKYIYVFIFSVSKERQYIFTLHKLCKEHALPHMDYFHSSFLKNTALAECWGTLCLRLKAQESRTQHRGGKICVCHLCKAGKCPRRDNSNLICSDQEKQEVKLHPALPSSTKEQNCDTLASLAIPTTQWWRKEC